MLDNTRIRLIPKALPNEILTDPDKFFSCDLLDGGQIVPTKKFRKDLHGANAYIYIGPSDAITVEATLKPGSRLMALAYKVNLSKMIWGHNGASLTADQMHLALSQLVEHLEQLFESREVALSLVPGLSPNNRAWWEMLEIATHRLDPELALFNAFNSASHPCSHKRYVSLHESVRIGGRRSKTAISIYRKQVEMKAKHKESNVTCDEEILRLEIILKSNHLYREFSEINSPSVQFQVIDGTSRLTGFSWDDLKTVHRGVMSKCKGSYDDAPPSKDKTDAIGRFIALCHHKFSDGSSHTVHDFLKLYQEVSRATTNKMGLVRAACMQQRERSALGTQRFAEQFSEEAYAHHPRVKVPKKERVTTFVREHERPINAVVTRYGTPHHDQSPPPWQ